METSKNSSFVIARRRSLRGNPAKSRLKKAGLLRLRLAMTKKILFSSLFLALTACTTSAPSITPSLPSFTASPKINMDVANIEVIEAYKSPFVAPNIEHIMPYTPADAMQIWVKDRLRAVGTTRLLQITIVDASVTEHNLPRTQGLSGLFTIDQDRKFEARLEVEMRIYGDKTLSDADTSVIVTRSITIPENASVNSRKAAYLQMLHDMMETMDMKLDKNIHDYLGNYIGDVNIITDRKA